MIDIHILGRTTDFNQKVKSLQIEHDQIESAEGGMEVALKVERRVRREDKGLSCWVMSKPFNHLH